VDAPVSFVYVFHLIKFVSVCCYRIFLVNKDILIIAISTTNTEWQRFSAVTVNVKSGFLKIFSKKPKKN